MASQPANGFAQKILNIVMVALATLLLGFFTWMATAIFDIQIKAARIDEKVTSLLETRTNQANETAARTARRVDQLEQDAEKK